MSGLSIKHLKWELGILAKDILFVSSFQQYISVNISIDVYVYIYMCVYLYIYIS